MRRTFFSLLCCSILFYSCQSSSDKSQPAPDGHNTMWTIGPFEKADSLNPIMTPGKGTFTDPILQKPVEWEIKDVFNPAAIVRNDTVYLLYRAEDTVGKYAGTSRIGLAYSRDGLHFSRFPEPVLFPANDPFKKYEWEGGCEDPRVVENGDGNYIMTYTAYDGTTARLMVAVSPDLFHWKKYGPAFSEAYNGRYAGKWSKSGSIVSKYENGHITAAKINGKYWMYWGDVNIWAATSDDCIHWSPVLYEDGQKADIELRRNAGEVAEVRIVIGPRKRHFDSDLVESGPPAMLTDRGILLLYNSRNIPSIGDSSLKEGTYAAGQVLLDKNDPLKVLQRTDTCFIKPDKPYEQEGQVNEVCFVEGLVHVHNKWFLYYGTADSKIAVATIVN